MNRHDNTLSIQQGACNLSGIAHALLRGIEECRNEGCDIRTDPAVRLIVHQMAHLASVGESTGFSEWDDCMKACEKLSPKHQEKVTRFMTVAEKYTHMKRKGEFLLEFENTLNYQYAIRGTINLEYIPTRIEFHALRNEDMAGEWVPTGFGFCGEARAEARERVTNLASDISKLVDGYVGVVATDDPGMF